ncbi:MAG: M16 family metallopeptidase [Ignavibacteriaceae bacterium]
MNSKISILLLVFVIFIAGSFAQHGKLPIDKRVKIGTLSNGIKYYIQENKKPEKRCELRLVVNAGSVLENDDQKGLAHFVEHMAFNGSKNFRKNELIGYLESIGVKFGPELNAYTSFDETVYMLQVPTDKQEIVTKAFLVLQDWASGLSFDSVEIEKERGVITEEWRLGRGANMRMLDKQLPVIFKNSKYAERLTIGDINIIKNFEHQTLKDYYRDWYRPDLMAVVAVGDFDAVEIEKMIRENFEGIKSPKLLRVRELYTVPKNKETLFAIASDKEATNSVISIYNKHEAKPTTTIEDYKEDLITSLFSGMLNMRFQELTRLPNPPFIQARAGNTNLVKTVEAFSLAAAVKEGEIEKGLETLLREAERVRLHGFTETELARLKTILLRRDEQMLAEKDKQESSNIIGKYINNYLYDNPIMGEDDSYELNKKLFAEITLEEVNKIAAGFLTTENRVVMVSIPEKESTPLPTEEGLTSIIEKIGTEKIEPYKDFVQNQPLVKDIKSTGKIEKETGNEKLGYTEWKLSNGVRVILKRTDFKNDEIMLRAFSPGGNSLVDDKDYISAITTGGLIDESGLGKFTKDELLKLLAGKIARVTPFINSNFEGMSGNCSPRDLETFLQLIYLYFTEPRIDSIAFVSFTTKTSNYLQNLSNDPQSAFSDTLSVTLSNYHFRNRPWTPELLNEMDLNVSKNFFKERFGDASDFTFLLVGNIDPNESRGLIEKYLGTLPSLNRNESWKTIIINRPEGIVEKNITKGIEQKSSIGVVFHGEIEWSRENEYKFESLVDALNITLREVIREEKGGTYGIRVTPSISKVPKSEYTINISWGTNPGRVDELTEALFKTIDSLISYGPGTETLNKVKETQRRTRETRIKQNAFWVGMLFNYLMYKDNPELILEYNKWVDQLTTDDIKESAGYYLDKNRFIKIVLYPEKKE